MIVEVLVKSYSRPFKRYSRIERVASWRKCMESVYLCTEAGLESLKAELNVRTSSGERHTISEPQQREWDELDPMHRHRLSASPDGCYLVLTTVH